MVKKKLTLATAGVSGLAVVYGVMQLAKGSFLFRGTAGFAVIALAVSMITAIAIMVSLLPDREIREDIRTERLLAQINKAMYDLDPYKYADSLNDTVAVDQVLTAGLIQLKSEGDSEEIIKKFLTFVEDVEIDEEIEEIVKQARKAVA